MEAWGQASQLISTSLFPVGSRNVVWPHISVYRLHFTVEYVSKKSTKLKLHTFKYVNFTGVESESSGVWVQSRYWSVPFFLLRETLTSDVNKTTKFKTKTKTKTRNNKTKTDQDQDQDQDQDRGR